MRRPTLIISILLLSISIIVPTQTLADEVDNDLLKIYQDRRSGDQMNLETWYGGKYGGTLEESIGFGDIILLDLMEKVGGTSSDVDMEKFKTILETLVYSQNSQTPQDLPQKGAIQGTARLISLLYQKPAASSIDYLAYVQSNIQNKQIVQPAFADEGFGFGALGPVLEIWKTFRNISYFAFVLGFIAYGFMIMFRIKINPQTAITIQLALPKLIVTLLLITFSYAIAGFMIDLFYLIWGILFNIFVQGGITSQSLGEYTSGYKWGLIIPFLTSIVTTSKFIILDLWSAILPIPQAVSGILSFNPIFMGINLLVFLVLLIAIFVTFLKIFWMLLKSYVNIILNIIFSPLILLGNLLPGSKSFGNWIKNIFAELSVFISVMTMFLLSFYFMWQFDLFTTGSKTNLWNPQPLFAGKGVDPTATLSLLGLGILLMTPKIAEIIKNALQIKDAGYGSAISEALFLPTASKAWEKYSTEKASKAIDTGFGALHTAPEKFKEGRAERKKVDKSLSQQKTT